MDTSKPFTTLDSLSSDLPTDEELNELAMNADTTAPVDLSATPYHFGIGFDLNALPQWYMPSPMAGGRGRGTRVVIASIVVGMIVVCAFGLCVTSGFLQLA
jgi:hypothetical protein